MGLIGRLFGGRRTSRLPPDKNTLIKTSRGGWPAIAVVNGPMAAPQVQARFRWHLSIVVVFADRADNGMPTPTANERVNQLEDQIESQLQLRENAVFISRVTCNGRREFSYRVRDPKTVEETVRRWVAAPGQVREWSYELSFDPGGSQPRAAFGLLERAKK